MSRLSIVQFIKDYYPQYFGIEAYPAEKCARIHKVDEEWGILCNFARTQIVAEGVTFKSAEQLFQCLKFNNTVAVRAVYASANPKMAAKRKDFDRYRRVDWGQMILDAMKFCLQKKYEQNEAFREKLERSQGLFIVEDQTTFTKKNPDAWGVKPQGDNLVGPNLLGRFLMELRDNGKLEYIMPVDCFDFIRNALLA